nr:Chain C, Vimentin [Homo sapiens]
SAVRLRSSVPGVR